MKPFSSIALRTRRSDFSRLSIGKNPNPHLAPCLIALFAMAVAMLPLSLIGSMWVMGAWLFVAGFAIAPTLVASLSLVEQSVPQSRLTEGMAIVETALVAGVAPGAALAGHLIDSHGASTGYLVSLVAGLVAAAAAFASHDERPAEPSL